MVGVAQLAEHWIVIPAVVGSSPIVHPRLPLAVLSFKKTALILNTLIPLTVFSLEQITERLKIPLKQICGL